MQLRDDLDDMNKVDLFPGAILDPKTKHPIKVEERLDCKPETAYETGMIFCKERKLSSRNLAMTIATVIVIIIVSAFLFSLKITIKKAVASTFTSFITIMPFLIVIAAVSIAIAVAIKARRN